MIPNGGRGGSPADTVALVGGTVAVALDPPELACADLVIAGGRIAAVGTAPQGTARRDCRRARSAMCMSRGSLSSPDRRSTRVDEAKLAAETAAGAGQIWDRLQATAAHAFEPMGNSR
jgi:hypothetical protein